MENKEQKSKIMNVVRIRVCLKMNIRILAISCSFVHILLSNRIET